MWTPDAIAKLQHSTRSNNWNTYKEYAQLINDQNRRHMYDEPFSGLDPISLGTAAQLIRQLNDTLGITSIVVSHDLEETFRIADKVIILANGSIAAQGTPDEVRRSADPLVHQFVNAESEGPVKFHYPGPGVEADFGNDTAAQKERA